MVDWLKEYITAEQIAVAELVLLAVISILFGILFYLIVSQSEKRVKKNDGKYVERMLASTGDYMEKFGKYEQTKLFLSQYGANYMMGRHVAPEEYGLINIALALLFGLFGSINFGILGLVIGLVVGFFLLKVLLILSNQSDNDKILYDMKGIYDTLKMKTEGGMFLTAALSECYKVARNKRLKTALHEMQSEIIAKRDIPQAVENFNVKFKNKYIDTFCVIIRQSLESGKTVEILKDMSDQLTEMQKAINVKIKAKLEAQINAVQMMIYVGLLIMIVYSLIMFVSEFSLI